MLADGFFIVSRSLAWPLGGLIVLGLVGLGILIWHLRNPVRVRATGNFRAEPPITVVRSFDGLTALKIQDLNFSIDQFLGQTQKRILHVTAERSAGRLAAVRRFVSDAMYVRFRAEAAMLARRGVREVLAHETLEPLRLVAIDGDEVWETIHVKVTGKVRRLLVPLDLAHDEAKRRVAWAPMVPVAQVWSLLRQASARTSLDGGPLQGRCPACFSELPRAQVTRCGICRVLCNAGTHDWVVSDIVPADHWRPRSRTGLPPSVAVLRERDHGLTRERLRDQATLLFWRWIEARVVGDAKRLVRHAVVPPAELAVKSERSDPLRRVRLTLVELIACDPVADGVWERCYLRLNWTVEREGRAEPVPWRRVMVLVRKVGITTSPGCASLVCRHCFAPLDSSAEAVCRTCGMSNGAAEREWAIEAMVSTLAGERLRLLHLPAVPAVLPPVPAGPPGPTVLEALDVPDPADPFERELVLGVVVQLLTRDGPFDARTRKLLERWGERWRIEPQRLAGLLTVPPGEPTRSEALIGGLDHEDVLSLLGGLLAAALQEDRIQGEDQALIALVTRRLDLPETTLQTLLERARKRRYTEAMRMSVRPATWRDAFRRASREVLQRTLNPRLFGDDSGA